MSPLAVRPVLGSALLAFASTFHDLPAFVAQVGTDPRGVESAPTYPWYLEGIGAALITLVVGGLLIALAPRYTTRVTDRALERPGRAFLYGVGLLIGVIGLAFLLAITGIGLIIAIPLLLAFLLVAIVAGEFGYLAAGRLAGEGWAVALLVAVAVSLLVGSVPILGGLVGFVVSTIGVGAFVVDVLES